MNTLIIAGLLLSVSVSAQAAEVLNLQGAYEGKTADNSRCVVEVYKNNKGNVAYNALKLEGAVNRPVPVYDRIRGILVSTAKGKYSLDQRYFEDEAKIKSVKINGSGTSIANQSVDYIMFSGGPQNFVSDIHLSFSNGKLSSAKATKVSYFKTTNWQFTGEDSRLTIAAKLLMAKFNIRNGPTQIIESNVECSGLKFFDRESYQVQ